MVFFISILPVVETITTQPNRFKICIKPASFSVSRYVSDHTSLIVIDINTALVSIQSQNWASCCQVCVGTLVLTLAIYFVSTRQCNVHRNWIQSALCSAADWSLNPLRHDDSSLQQARGWQTSDGAFGVGSVGKAGTDVWSVLVTHLIGAKKTKIYCGIWQNICQCVLAQSEVKRSFLVEVSQWVSYLHTAGQQAQDVR